MALQVFYNLGQLETALVTVLISYRNVVQHEIQNAVDPTSLLQSSIIKICVGLFLNATGQGIGNVRTGSVNWKGLLWTRLDKLTNSLMKVYKQV